MEKMYLKKIISLLLPILFVFVAFAQPDEHSKVDEELTAACKNLQRAGYDLRQTLAPMFRKGLQFQLTQAANFNNPFDSLSRQLSIVSSADKKIRFFSWDEGTGATHHAINTLAQFKGTAGRIICRLVDSYDQSDDDGFSDSKIYEVNQVTENGKTWYITFGWGTFGGGVEHTMVMVFRIIGDKLEKCESFYVGETELLVEYRSGEDANVLFNKNDHSISFDEVKYNEKDEIPIPRKTGKSIKMKFSNGKFKEVPYSIPATSGLPKGAHYQAGKIILAKGYSAADYHDKEIAIIYKPQTQDTTGAIKCNCTIPSHRHYLSLGNSALFCVANGCKNYFFLTVNGPVTKKLLLSSEADWKKLILLVE